MSTFIHSCDVLETEPLTYFIVCNFSMVGQHCLNVSIITLSIFQPKSNYGKM